MKDYYAYLVTLSLTLFIILSLALAPPVPHATGAVHPRFKTMQKSVNSQSSSPMVKYLGFAFGLSIIAIFGLSLYWGSKRPNKSGFKKRDLWVGSLLYTVMYFGMVLSAWKYEGVESPLWGSVPIGTAWMLYGIWLAPITFVILYVYGFKQHVMSDEDEQAFQALIANRQGHNSSS